MIRFDYENREGKQTYTAKTMDGQPLGFCQFFLDGYVCVIEDLCCDEADITEGLCRAAFDKGLQNMCPYGEFRGKECSSLEKTCFKNLEKNKTFLVTPFFHTCCNCGKK